MELSKIDLYKKFEVKNDTNIECPADADAFYTKYMEQELNNRIQELLITLALKTNTQDDLMFYRGTLNGFLVVRD